MSRQIVLLRGINVGGRNKVPMADLRSVLGSAGFANVNTYIQSGNIALDSDMNPHQIAARICDLLEEHFNISVPVVSVEQNQVSRILEVAPFDPEGNPGYQLVYFPGGPVNVDGFESIKSGKYEGDIITATSDAVYVAYGSGQSSSKLTLDVLERAAGVALTGRNIRSVAKLITL